jgi:hypothetical protein
MNTTAASPRALTAFTVLFGLAAAGSGIGSLMGLSNPTYAGVSVSNGIVLDNNLRFYSGIWFALGLVTLWLARHLQTEIALFRAVFFTVFVGGCGRVLSMVFAGEAPPEFIAYAVIEILGAPAVIGWHYRVVVRR